MNTTKLRTKRVLIPTALAVVALSAGGVVWASTADADLRGSERDRVAAAATQAVGGGEVIDTHVLEAESSDDPGEAYEVEVLKGDGSKIDVTLDQDLRVLHQEADDRDDNVAGATQAPDADDRVLSATERASAEKAALAAVGGGRVTKLEASDDRGEAYEAEVRTADNTDWDVSMDAGFKVLNKAIDR